MRGSATCIAVPAFGLLLMATLLWIGWFWSVVVIFGGSTIAMTVLCWLELRQPSAGNKASSDRWELAP